MAGPEMQDWHDQSEGAAWRTERPWNPPYKHGGNPFFKYSHGQDPRNVMIDVAHSFHIKGIGCDFAASAVVLMGRKGLFGAGPIDAYVYRAYCRFMEFCHLTHRTTAVRPWSSRRQLDMTAVNSFPTSINGKGYDTALVCIWLGKALGSLQDAPEVAKRKDN